MGLVRQQCLVWWYHNVPWYCRQNAKGNHRSCPKHNEDQDHCSPRTQILCMDRRFHPCFPLHLPTNVDHQARIRRSRPTHCPQKMLLNFPPTPTPTTTPTCRATNNTKKLFCCMRLWIGSFRYLAC